MSVRPEFVCTGVHVPKVQFWARVLVQPDRLQQVRHAILNVGHVYLAPGDVLEVDTRLGDEIKRAMTVWHRDSRLPKGACLVAWNEGEGDIDIYSDDADRIAAIAGPVVEALVKRQPREPMKPEVFIHCETIDTIRVGNVQVFFERVTEAKAGLESDRDADEVEGLKLSPGTELKMPPGAVIGDAYPDDEPDEYLAARRRIKELTMQIIGEKNRIQRLRLRPRAA